MAGHDIIVIGASAGGVEALTRLVGGLPKDLAASLFVVLHIPADARSLLPTILDKASPLCAAHARDGEAIEPGRIYVARPDHHLLVDRGRVRVSRGPRENRNRPAVDPLFRTAAVFYGPRVVGVVLSGVLDDGTAGLLAIKRRGGVAVVQDPEEALYDGMPSSALEHVDVDYCLSVKEMPSLLVRLSGEPAADEALYPVLKEMEMEADFAHMKPSALESNDLPGKISTFTCPECKGPLWELQDGDLTRFRCRVGHAFTADSMLSGKTEAVEEALWVAFNTLEENALMSRKLARNARDRGNKLLAERFDQKADETMRRAETIRALLIGD